GELVRSAWIEAAIGTPGEPRDLAERLLGDRIVALLEHEGRHAEEPQLAGQMTQIVELLFHGVADEDQRLHARAARLALGMGDDLADLGVATAAIDSLHQRGEPFGLRHPTGGPAFAETAVIHELHVEAADGCRLAEHIGLQLAGAVPRGLSAHGRIERENEPPAAAGFARWREALDLGEKGVDFRARSGRRRRTAALTFRPLL